MTSSPTHRLKVGLSALITLAFLGTAQCTALAQETALQIFLAVDQPTSLPSESITYTVTVVNSGGVAAERVRVLPELPVQFVYADGATPQYLAGLGSLAAGEKVERKILVRIPTDTIPNRYTFTATALADNSASIRSQVDVEIRAPQVLGASNETLNQNFDLYVYLASGAIALTGAWIWIKRRQTSQPKV